MKGQPEAHSIFLENLITKLFEKIHDTLTLTLTSTSTSTLTSKWYCFQPHLKFTFSELKKEELCHNL